MTIILWIGGGIALLLLVFGLVLTRREQALVDQRLDRYLEEEEDQAAGDRGSALTDWINVQVEETNFGDRIAKELAQADLKLKPGEYVLLVIAVSLGTGVIGYFYGGTGGFRIFFAIVGLVIGYFLVRWYVKRQQKKRLQHFDEQLPDMLNLMVNGLRAGYSTMQAMEAVSKELPSPISDEFRRVVREMQLGISMEVALDNLLRRIPSADLDFIITAVNIQRETGGNLAEILDIISYTIRERIRIRREIQTLVAQVLYSGRILAIMPIALAGFLWFINRPYMEQFFLPGNEVCGIAMLATGGLMITAGYFAMNKVADIEI